MGLFLVIAGSWAFFGPITLEKAQDICEPSPITKECYIEALQPIDSANHDGYNQ